jgi:hypothetical protein
MSPVHAVTVGSVLHRADAMAEGAKHRKETFDHRGRADA